MSVYGSMTPDWIGVSAGFGSCQWPLLCATRTARTADRPTSAPGRYEASRADASPEGSNMCSPGWSREAPSVGVRLSPSPRRRRQPSGDANVSSSSDPAVSSLCGRGVRQVLRRPPCPGSSGQARAGRLAAEPGLGKLGTWPGASLM